MLAINLAKVNGSIPVFPVEQWTSSYLDKILKNHSTRHANDVFEDLGDPHEFRFLKPGSKYGFPKKLHHRVLEEQTYAYFTAQKLI